MSAQDRGRSGQTELDLALPFATATATATEPVRLALAGLARVTEPGQATVHRAVTAHGPVAVWEALRAGRAGCGLSAALAAAAGARAEGFSPAEDLRRAEACGARLIGPGDPEWPTERLTWQPVDKLEVPPLWLYVRGAHALAEVVQRSVAVVGARAATAYGVHVAKELACALTDRGWAVVSGGAYGIDIAAHKGALLSGRTPTVAVLACGVDVAYPSGNDRDLALIAAQGLVVSELPPGSRPTRRHFLVRNRLIAALSVGTVVVEAAARSGSLATVARAASLDRQVMAVPGAITSAMSAGCHEQIRNGAVCVTSVGQVLEQVGRLGVDLDEPVRGPVSVRDGLSETVNRVLDALPVRTAIGVLEIARTAAVTPLVVQQVLPPLLAHGLVERTDDGWRLTPLGSGRPVRRRGPAA